MKDTTSLVLRSLHAPAFRFVVPAGSAPCLGRSTSCDFVILDSSVSRRHALLRIDASKIRIDDLGSRNGTFVGNERIADGCVGAGEEVRFGNIRFLVGNPNTDEDDETDDLAGRSQRDGRKDPFLVKGSDAQRRVLKHLLDGLQEKAIARLLGLSSHTVHQHTQAIYRIFGVHSRAKLLAKFITLKE